MDKEPNITTPLDDGAGEKLVDEKNGQHPKGLEVIYITPSSHNGDAKIDIENLKSRFAGMGKEELMKFANDPFWVRMRWFLFILFWLLWVAMLAGAIAIIVFAPKCAAPVPRKWWEQSPMYKADISAFGLEPGKIHGDLKGFSTRLDYFKKLGVKTVIVSNILKVSDKGSDGFDEFKTVAPSFGTLDDFKALIAAAKERGLKLLLTLVPNHSSLKNPFFNESISKTSQYSSYYVWAPMQGFTTEGKPQPPNNWLSRKEGSAWEWNEERGEFYLHQFDKDQPEFNFHNPDVVSFFTEVMQFWLNLGVSGFYIERTPYLLEDSQLRNESAMPRGASYGSEFDHTQYGFYSHDRTKNLPELETLLGGWTTTVNNASGVFVVDEAHLKNRSAVHLIVQPKVMKPYPEFTADELLMVINKTLLSNPWPAWQMTLKDEQEGSPLSQALLVTSLLLPGMPVTLGGQELGLKDLTNIPAESVQQIVNENEEELGATKPGLISAYKKLVKERYTTSLMYGRVDLHVFNGTSVFAYSRQKSGSPGYLVVLNTGDEESVVDARTIRNIPDDLTPIVCQDFVLVCDKVKSEGLTLPSRTVYVYSFVPKSPE